MPRLRSFDGVAVSYSRHQRRFDASAEGVSVVTSDLPDFVRLHLAALEADEVRFNIQIAVITAAANEPPPGFAWWTLGAPGHCAVRYPGRHLAWEPRQSRMP